MFIDYVSLLLINTMIGYFLLAGYVYSGLDDRDQGKWAVGFLMSGLIAVVFGGLVAATWPLPGPYDTAYGEMSVLLGIIFLGAGLAMVRGWSLLLVAVYGFFAGWAAVVMGIRIIQLKLTLVPGLAGVGFILSGLAGVFAAPTLSFLRNHRPFRTLAAIVLFVTALVWAVVVYPEYWFHMQQFGKWVPLVSRAAAIRP
jgi:putative membrane protein